jgi:hypothetical protein
MISCISRVKVTHLRLGRPDSISRSSYDRSGARLTFSSSLPNDAAAQATGGDR